MLKDIRQNPLMLTDCYNLSHQRLKTDTSYETSHMYNRANPMIFFGFQEIVTNLLEIKITMDMVMEAEKNANRLGLEFPKELFVEVVEKYNGNIPIRVESLPEGTFVPKGTPFAQISNTVEGFGELVTYFEGVFMMAYFPSSCATEAYNMKKYLDEKQKQYGFDDGFLWRFHSFGFRGHKSLEDSYFAGTAWSLFLQGTDDFHIAQHIPVGVMGSIPALAHKVTQQFDEEYQCFIHSIDAVAGKENIVALVIDTYDAWNVINNYIVSLSEYAKEKGVHIVFRPDSGDILEQARAIYEISNKNKLSNVNVIIGEGMSFENAKKADEYFEENNVPLSFIFYGIGAGFYKNIERDTLGWAMKTAYSNGKPRMKVVKSNPFKQSIPNVVHLKYDENGEMIVHDGVGEGLYETVYEYNPVYSKPLFIKNINEDHFDKVRNIALKQNTTQLKIKLSEETQDLIQQIIEQHE